MPVTHDIIGDSKSSNVHYRGSQIPEVSSSVQ
jgi:hypothetical protein